MLYTLLTYCPSYLAVGGAYTNYTTSHAILGGKRTALAASQRRDLPGARRRHRTFSAARRARLRAFNTPDNERAGVYHTGLTFG